MNADQQEFVGRQRKKGVSYDIAHFKADFGLQLLEKVAWIVKNHQPTGLKTCKLEATFI